MGLRRWSSEEDRVGEGIVKRVVLRRDVLSFQRNLRSIEELGFRSWEVK